jgi:predicted Ser/Thr protein kinase
MRADTMRERLGKYELTKVLGKGGMGIVYLARDIESAREVALKILPPELTRNPKYVRRFHREAKAVSLLHHPNIIQIYDIGKEKETYFFAMEYLGGLTLRRLLEQRGRLSIPDAVSIIVQIADALDVAHGQGIIHRDVKPDNIMSDETGKFKVMDFGIAHTEEGTRLTVTGTIMGTPEYMSPEQASGTAVDRRTDIYALGIVFYEMLTGRVPFHGQTAVEVLQMHITKIPESPKLVNPEIPGNLANIIAKMIEKQPADRYDSFRHVINAINQSLPQQLRKSVGATARDIEAVPSRRQEQPAPRPRERVLLQTPPMVQIALAASIILNILLFGFVLLRKGQPSEAIEPIRPVFSLGGQMFAPPTLAGSSLILAAEDGVVRAFDVESGAVKWTFQTTDKVTAAPVVEKGLVYIGSWDRNLYALGTEDGSLQWKTPVGGCIFAAPVITDGTLYVCTREGNVLAIDPASGEQRWQQPTGARTDFAPAIHEGSVYVASDTEGLIALNAADGKRIGEFGIGKIKMPVAVLKDTLFYAAFDDVSGSDELIAAAAADFTDNKFVSGKSRWKTAIGAGYESNAPGS